MFEQEHDPELILKILEDSYPGKIHNARTGREYIFQCPFCGGDSRGHSFHLNIDKGFGHCWRANNCGWKGNVVSFFMEAEKLDEDEAKELVGISPITIEASLLKELDGLLTKKKVESFQMKENEDNYHVVGSVKITESNYKDYPDFLEWMKERSFDAIDFVNKHSIFYPPQFGYNKNRIVFQIESLDNRVYLSYSMDRRNKIKTVNAKEADVSKYLYNFNHAKDKELIFITEGIFDAARLLTYSFDRSHSAVSLFGTTLNEDTTDVKTRLLQMTKAKEIVVCLDNGAEKQAWQIYHHLRKWLDKAVSIMFLPIQGSDPDELPEKLFKEAYERRKRSRKLDVDDILQSCEWIIQGR